MTSRLVLLGPDGQLGHAVRRAHAATGEPFELIALPRAALDIAVPGMIERVLGDRRFDVLLNCAAWTEVDAAEDDAGRAFAVNAHAVRSLAAVCSARQARLIHISTDYVFGGDTSRDRPLPEDAPTAPINVYGESKALGETLARAAHHDVVVVRTASLFGATGGGGRGGNFVETIIRNGREAAAHPPTALEADSLNRGRALAIGGERGHPPTALEADSLNRGRALAIGGEQGHPPTALEADSLNRQGRDTNSLRIIDDQRMSPTSSADVAGVLMRMVTEGCAPGCYHVVNSGSATWFEFAQAIVRGAGIDATVTPCPASDFPSRASRPHYSVLDNSMAVATFGAIAHWQDALVRYLQGAEQADRWR